MNKIFISISILLLIAAFSSCDEPERTILTPDERDLVDSLYAKRVPYVRVEADSMCDAIYQSLFDRFADSIKLTYIKEIKEIVDGE